MWGEGPGLAHRGVQDCIYTVQTMLMEATVALLTVNCFESFVCGKGQLFMRKGRRPKDEKGNSLWEWKSWFSAAPAS